MKGTIMSYPRLTTIENDVRVHFPPDGTYRLQIGGDTVDFSCDKTTQTTNVPGAGSFGITKADEGIIIIDVTLVQGTGVRAIQLSITPDNAGTLACLFHLLASQAESQVKNNPPF